MPVTMPVVVVIFALVVSLLLHVPPLTLLLRVAVPPMHTLKTPVIAPGARLVVKLVVATQPLGAI